MRSAQTAVEYLLMMAAVLIIVMIAFNTITGAMRKLNDAVNSYINQTRAQLLENL